MSMRAFSLAAIAAMILAFAAGSASAAGAAFHPPQTPAEQTLARILKLDGDKPRLVDPAVAARGRKPLTTPPANAGYLAYLTVPVATAILADEAGQVKTNCGGVYKSGEECGMDSDPIICAQDFPASYLVRTLKTGPGLAVIEAAWPPDGNQPISSSGVYRLKQVSAVWKIDGIACTGGDKYN
jgi:hypothetical protein